MGTMLQPALWKWPQHGRAAVTTHFCDCSDITQPFEKIGAPDRMGLPTVGLSSLRSSDRTYRFEPVWKLEKKGPLDEGPLLFFWRARQDSNL
jgi:hypothetical protein